LLNTNIRLNDKLKCRNRLVLVSNERVKQYKVLSTDLVHTCWTEEFPLYERGIDDFDASRVQLYIIPDQYAFMHFLSRAIVSECIVFVIDLQGDPNVRNWAIGLDYHYYHFHPKTDMELFLKELYYTGLRDVKDEAIVAPFTQEIRRASIIDTIFQSFWGRKLGSDLCASIQVYLPLWRIHIQDFLIPEMDHIKVENYERSGSNDDCNIS